MMEKEEVRYGSQEMASFFTLNHKALLWRKLWTELAKAQKTLGLPITEKQIKQLEAKSKKVNLDRALSLEKEIRHDVMAHIKAFAEDCPEAKGIIHLGATSCFVTDNADILIFKEALGLILAKLTSVLQVLKVFAVKYKKRSCLGFTHFQAAQPTTLGKRACLWLQDFLADAEDLHHLLSNLKMLGIKGATGTQASFVELFDGNTKKVDKLEKSLAKALKMEKVYTIASQTYSRKQDMKILGALVGIAVSSHKMATDLRLLSHLKEIREPFLKNQVGSSAMPYKKNPHLSERICGIARFVMALGDNPIYTAATQWLERSLDDSSNRRLYFPQAFLAVDAILNILLSLIPNLYVDEKRIEKNLEEELPFLLMEPILMHLSKQGKDRQKLHEKLRLHAKEKEPLKAILKDKGLGITHKEIQKLSQHLTGRAEEQTVRFIRDEVDPFLKGNPPYKGPITTLAV